MQVQFFFSRVVYVLTNGDGLHFDVDLADSKQFDPIMDRLKHSINSKYSCSTSLEAL